jgi:DNA-binding Xre family transcriptional regulator
MAATKKFQELSKEVRKRPGAAEEIEARKRGIIAAVRLNELRQRRQQTQADLADLLGTTQANISRIEHADNLYLRTLNEYVEGLGGRLEINAVFDDDILPLGLVEATRK